jgi:coenzyme F420 biosynthesis associated uncharacterized protein
MTDLIRGDVAEKTAAFLLREPPSAGSGAVSKSDLQEVSAFVQELTGLSCDISDLEIVSVSRRVWVRRNVDWINSLAHQAQVRPSPPGLMEVSSGVIGAVLAHLGTRVLGQYFPDESPSLLLVEANIGEAAQRAKSDPREFARWVLVHELTHRAQFEGAPGFARYVRGRIVELLSIPQPRSAEVLLGLMEAVIRGFSTGEFDFRNVFVPTRARGIMSELMAAMTVAEGHGEWVMRRAPLSLVPHRDEFVAVVDSRRKSPGLNRAISGVTGMAAKQRQYTNGRIFFDRIEQLSEGSSQLVFSQTAYLPTLAEIADPDLWIQRVVEPRAAAGRRGRR